MRANVTDLIGKVYGRLTVVSFDRIENKKSYWNCKCSCGGEKSILRSSIIYFTRSCGCLQKENTSKAKSTHRESIQTGNSKEYRAWGHMIGRCMDEKDHRYYCYGGRGITVCKRWRDSYDNFLTDMGRAPSPKHSLDRRDVNGNYEPSNCRWATRIEQANNTTRNYMITFNDKTMSVSDWGREIGIAPSTLIRRIKYYGWTIENALASGLRINQYK
jgi:hypothetical protein